MILGRVLKLMEVPALPPCHDFSSVYFLQAYAPLGATEAWRTILALAHPIAEQGAIRCFLAEWEHMEQQAKADHVHNANLWRVCLPDPVRRALSPPHMRAALGTAIRVVRTHNYTGILDNVSKDVLGVLRFPPKTARTTTSTTEKLVVLVERLMDEAVGRQSEAHTTWRQHGAPMCPPLVAEFLRWTAHLAALAAIPLRLLDEITGFIRGLSEVINNEIWAVEIRLDLRDQDPKGVWASCPPTHLALVEAAAAVATYRAVLHKIAQRTGYRSPWIAGARG